jgi:spermidine synthase
VLFVDGFDNKGQPPQLCSQQFYSDCYRSLTPQGLLVVNLGDGGSVLISRIRRSFRNDVVVADGELSVAVCNSEAVALRHPVMPVGNGFGGRFVRINSHQL